MLSKAQMVKARAAIESMYDGVCTVTVRQQHIKENGATGFEEVNTITGQPCRLSYSSAAETTTGPAAEQSTSVKLYIAPELNIPAGSKITITQAGVTRAYTRSGLPAVYETHQQIDLVLFERWA